LEAVYNKLVRSSLRQLLDHALDYAGLFPPARLEPVPALDEYRRWQSHEFGFTLGRFCCPISRLSELLPHLREGVSLEVAAIGQVTDSIDTWNTARESEARLLTDFQVKAGGVAEIQAFEVRLPEVPEAAKLLDDLQGFSGADVYVELPWNEAMTDTVAAAVHYDWLALKARTGGTRKGDVPDSFSLARFVWDCMSLETPFKLTAGLHHPLPNVNADTGDRQHGFLNVLTACVLAYAEEVPVKELSESLEISDPRLWEFQDDFMRFQDHVIRTADIDAAREIFTGFGSCSVEEPYDDLDALGFLTRTGPGKNGSNTR
jgi:hypothetical protein